MLEVPEVLEVHDDDIFSELRISPSTPKATNFPLEEEVAVVSLSPGVSSETVTSAMTGASVFFSSSSSLAQEMTVRLKRVMRIMCKILFNFYLHQ